MESVGVDGSYIFNFDRCHCFHLSLAIWLNSTSLRTLTLNSGLSCIRARGQLFSHFWFSLCAIIFILSRLIWSNSICLRTRTLYPGLGCIRGRVWACCDAGI